jgi:hypothetical protein
MQSNQTFGAESEKGIHFLRTLLDFNSSIDGEIGYCNLNHEREGVSVTHYIDFSGVRVFEENDSYDNHQELEADWLKDSLSNLRGLILGAGRSELEVEVLTEEEVASMAGSARIRITNPKYTVLDLDETSSDYVLRAYEAQLQVGER